MCLIVDENLQVSVNPEPKTVYKVFQAIENRLWSCFQYVGYVPGTEYSAEITETKEHHGACSSRDEEMIKNAYPSYRPYEKFPVDMAGIKSVVEGLHYCTDIEAAGDLTRGSYGSYGQDREIWECLIPAGAEIIESWGLGVTNKLTVVKKYQPE